MSQIIGEKVGETAAELVMVSSGRFDRREKYLGAAGALACFGLFWITGFIFRLPAAQHFNASLLSQPSAVSTLIVIALVFAMCVVIGTLIAGVIGFDAGVLCACAGLCAISIRGGAMRYTLVDDPTSALWTRLTIELGLLGGIIALGTPLQHFLLRYRLLHGDDHRHVVTEVHTSMDQRALALLTNILVTAAIMMLLAASDQKPQVLASVAIASFLGTLTAYYFVPTRPSAWYWGAPIVVGMLGYLAQMSSGSAGWQIGEVRGTFAGLARTLPLDYAGAGVPAAIIGYWMSRRWQHEREIGTVAGNTES